MQDLEPCCAGDAFPRALQPKSPCHGIAAFPGDVTLGAAHSVPAPSSSLRHLGCTQADGDRASLRSLWAASAGMRPAPLERVFGLDCVLPNTAGSGRACVWWSPDRREAMAELRLC